MSILNNLKKLNQINMRINYKETALGFLENPEGIDFALPPAHVPMSPLQMLVFKQTVQKSFKDIAPMFKKKIRYVSMPFIEAYDKAKHKLVNVFYKETLDESGTLILRRGSFTNTIFYWVKTYGEDEKQNWNYTLIYMVFNKHTQGDMNSLDAYIVDSQDKSVTFMFKGFADNGATKTDFEAFIITFLCFLKYVELETKVVEAGRKIHHAGEKYKNDTKQRVEILDSSWFTTIIRSAGFMVGDETGGFFRMQQCGKGNAERKLVWIQPFEKHGYTRKAKILTDK